MDILQIAGLGVVSSLILVLLRKERPDYALACALMAGLGLAFATLPKIREAIGAFGGMAAETGLEGLYFGIILKVLAISYVADFSAAVCRDAGEEAIATRVEMAGKILILVSGLPIVREVLHVVKTLLV